ncbi:hypothetical protein A2524_02550 [Candidatus Wolfebacteria bacterium RIFOXYD12_FULL_48_21]|uniref:Response regulatory domain-containing protein n=1 Tax=Candidatus Wolfebacteria bacterium RIFOXYD1_FULL_48_65 TaxID=1802561 RepID=A0A1F8E0N7_9BACT|nr:MAG: hypothetical protein A2610_01220 [Candidatus Wolfebacteria bacterium RIFOXYD1_FULL_48_65]OGM94748.1 MAG: hypothetical protein A2524_02550 [Candidatus Wolfebacteria bacterium RIFOXYD12_FULL_48_21]OGM95811.1 MAG: hypothetical protein A2532_00365 [Candidatus Wolfebacteria bacterium RIFOXYD2_FULL_48_11]
MSKKVLVVDDSLSMREFLSLLLLTELKNLDIEVTTASDGWTAFDAIGKMSFDLVLTDNNMPGMQGAELVVAVHDLGCKTPFIMVTGDEENDVPPVAKKMLKAFVPKPFLVDDFLELIRETLQ